MQRFIFSTLIIISFLSCRLDDNKKRKGPLHIVTTTGIIEDCVANIVMDSCEVTALMGPGTDPHIYKPTPGDVELLDEADVIIANGYHLEGKMSEMLQKYAKEKPVIFISDGISDDKSIKSADFDDAHDPHLWFDPSIWLTGLSYVADEMGKLDSNSAEYFKANFKSYEKQVNAADLEIKKLMVSVDSSKRILVTSHDAFSYFGRYYDVRVKGIQGVSTLSEVGLREISDMVDFVIANKLKSIFIETSTSEKTAQSIVDGCRDKGYEVLLSGPLYSDALGEPDMEAGTYIGMIKANAVAISQGLK